MTERTIVIKLSGSLFSSEKFSEVVRAIRERITLDLGLLLILVSGGGATARKYIAAGFALGLDQATLDELGIEASRLNAVLLREALSQFAIDSIPRNLRELVFEKELNQDKRILVTGGFHPGQSTNAVAAIIAEKTRADLFINATDVDGVYDKDPGMFRDAKKLYSVTPRTLSEILESESVSPGGYDLMDPVALKLIERSKVHTRIVKCDPGVISMLLQGRESVGTAIVFDS